MNRTLRFWQTLCIVTAAVALYAGVIKAAEEYSKVTIKISCNGATDVAPDVRTLNLFEKLVEEESGGNVQIEIYPGDQLTGGSMQTGADLLVAGVIEMALYPTTALCTLDEKLLIGTIPFVYDSYQDARQRIDSTGGKYYAKLLAAKGITFFCSTHNGFRQISNSRRPVRTPEDVSQLKIRVPGGQVFIDFWRAFNADPITMNWGETFTAIQQKTIDGQENGYATTFSTNIYEVQPYMTGWNYVYENQLMCINTAFYNTLTPATQKLLADKAYEACQWQRDFLEKEEEELKRRFVELGIELYEPTAEEIDAFRATALPVQQKYIKLYGEEAAAAFGLQ